MSAMTMHGVPRVRGRRSRKGLRGRKARAAKRERSNSQAMRRDAIEARRAAAEEWRQGGGVMTENQDPSPDPAVVVYIGRGFAGEAAP